MLLKIKSIEKDVDLEFQFHKKLLKKLFSEINIKGKLEAF
jgi:hypothetical protein